MNKNNSLEQQLEQLGENIAPGASIVEGVMERIESLPTPEARFSSWRLIVNKTWKPLSGTAALIVLYFGWAFFSSDSMPKAYAIEQTLKAHKGVQSIHLKREPPVSESIVELWAEFRGGQVMRMRYDFAETIDGPKQVLWSEGEAKVWLKKKNAINTIREEYILERLKLPYYALDPKLLSEELYRQQGDGKVNIQVMEAVQAGQFTTLTVTNEDQPERMKRFLVDPKTKLIQQIEAHKLRDGEFEFESRWIYLDYNQPIDDAVFQFDTPDEVVTIDWIRQQIGVFQGELSEKDVCKMADRSYFEALISKDYAAAGKIGSGIPAERVQELVGEMTFLHVVSVGEPQPHSMPGVGGYQVPCEVEVELDGKKEIMKKPHIAVRESREQPGYWYIHGGI
jgi:hypothetical protein